MQKADTLGLVELLIKKGIFTLDEYIEHMRLGANEELAMREAKASTRHGTKITFR